MAEIVIRKVRVDNKSNALAEVALSDEDKIIIENWRKRHGAKARYDSAIFAVEGPSLTERVVQDLATGLRSQTDEDDVEFMLE